MQFRIPENRVLVIVSLIVIVLLWCTEDHAPKRIWHPYLTFFAGVGQCR